MAWCSPSALRGTSAAAALTLLFSLPGGVSAQTSDPPRQTVQDVLGFLLTNQAVVTDDFARDQAATELTRETLARALLVNLATQPLGSSSGGFSYRFNPSLGTFERTSDSFGPILAERVQTAAPGQFTIGVAYRFASFTNLDGRDLRAGFITTANQFRDEQAPFDTEHLSMRLRTHTLALTANVGLIDRVELSATLPLVALQLEGERTNVYRDRTFVQASGEANVIGLGDAVARIKVRVAGERAAGLAVGADVRLPTGREEDLLGAGRTGVRFLAITSFEGPYAAAHGNAFIARGGLSDETGLAGALAFSPTPRLTVSGELLVRRLASVYAIEELTLPHPSIAGVDTLRLVAGTTATTMSVATGGFKWNVSETWLLIGSVATWIGDGGLTARWVPTVGIEYSFR
jgi:hypothetical protein